MRITHKNKKGGIDYGDYKNGGGNLLQNQQTAR